MKHVIVNDFSHERHVAVKSVNACCLQPFIISAILLHLCSYAVIKGLFTGM